MADRVYGGVALLLIVLAFFFAFRGGPRDGAASAAPPPIRIVEPVAGAASGQPLVLLFDAGTPLRVGPSGWGDGDRHVHVRIDATELMPGTTDIQPAGANRYRWTLPGLPAGQHMVQLFWSDAAHRPIRAGASAPVPVTLR